MWTARARVLPLIMPYLNKTLDTRMVEGARSNVRVLLFLENLDWRHPVTGKVYRILKGTYSDGLTVPPCLTNIIPSHGEWAWDGFLHDAGYHETLVEQRPDGGWMVPDLDKGGYDLLLKTALLEQGCPGWMAEAIYLAVSYGGSSAFSGDLLLTIPSIPGHQTQG